MRTGYSHSRFFTSIYSFQVNYHTVLGLHQISYPAPAQLKSGDIFMSGQSQPQADLLIRYETRFEHILTVQPNCLTDTRV